MSKETILQEVLQERVRQDQKWGEQNHQSVDPTLDYKLPSEEDAQVSCDAADLNGTLTWAHIAIEELCECVEASNDVERRMELIQLQAVILAWIECIDRRSKA